MESYSRDEVPECVSTYHTAEDNDQSVAVGSESNEPYDLQAVGGSHWFSNTSKSYTDFDSEIEYVAQYHHVAKRLSATNSDHPNGSRYPLGKEERDKRDGSRTILPPRDPSDASRAQVTRDVPHSQQTVRAPPRATALLEINRSWLSDDTRDDTRNRHAVAEVSYGNRTRMSVSAAGVSGDLHYSKQTFRAPSETAPLLEIYCACLSGRPGSGARNRHVVVEGSYGNWICLSQLQVRQSADSPFY